MMKTVRILHTADWHIGAKETMLKTKADTRRYETLTTAEKIIDLCNAQSVNLLLIAGDLFDNNRVENELCEKVFSLFDKLNTAQVVIALGNHDPLTADSPFFGRKLPENVTVLPSEDSVKEFPQFGCRVYGCSFDGVYKLGEAKFGMLPPQDDTVNIMVLHGETRSDLSTTYNPITPDFIRASGMDYLALGHIHKRSQIYKLGKTYFSYCGCPEGQGFDESGEKGVYLGEVGKDSVMLDFIPTARRTHILLDVDISESSCPAETVLEAIKSADEHFADDLFRITLTGTLPAGQSVNFSEIEAKVGANVWFLRLHDQTKVMIDLDALKEEKSVKGYFVRRMTEKIENAEEDERVLLEQALNLGLAAFDGEVSFRED